MSPVVVAALYQFVPISNPDALRDALFTFCKAQGIKGTLLLATEGINGTVAGSREAISALQAWLSTEGPSYGIVPHGMEYKESTASSVPFYRLKIRVKSEIVTMGVPELNPSTHAGQYVGPEEWNQLIADPDVIIVDTRNTYEVEIGTFERAIHPGSTHFREFPAYADTTLAAYKDKKIAMCCTGGIRCEKSTAYLRSRGFTQVYHLKGGILHYLEHTPKAESKWHGECFVFDHRVAVDHDVAPGQHQLCYGCKHPIRPEDLDSAQYEAGVSCPHCDARLTPSQRARARERQRQVTLAAARGQRHLGRIAQSERVER